MGHRRSCPKINSENRRTIGNLMFQPNPDLIENLEIMKKKVEQEYTPLLSSYRDKWISHALHMPA